MMVDDYQLRVAAVAVCSLAAAGFVLKAWYAETIGSVVIFSVAASFWAVMVGVYLRELVELWRESHE